jgi:pimeloyl-ACP methyl ester carboxylesterase
MALTRREQEELRAANASGQTPVMFIHGLWLLAGSWNPWREHFERHGYATLAPDWPNDPPSVEEARAHPEAVAKQSLGEVADHLAEVIGQLQRKPILIGHSTGGLIAQILAGRGLAAGVAAIDPGPFRGGAAVAVLLIEGGLDRLKGRVRRGRSPAASAGPGPSPPLPTPENGR